MRLLLREFRGSGTGLQGATPHWLLHMHSCYSVLKNKQTYEPVLFSCNASEYV